MDDGNSQRLTPLEAKRELLEGNLRFAEEKPLHPRRSETRREMIAMVQNPFVTLLACSDSRVPPEIIFDQGLGDLFVTRVAGNVVGPLELATITFGVEVLHTPLIMVMGHERCGAVTAAVDGQEALDHLEAIAPYLQLAVEKTKGEKDQLHAAVVSNVKNGCEYLRKIPRFRDKIAHGKLLVVGVVFDLDTGRVSVVD